MANAKATKRCMTLGLILLVSALSALPTEAQTRWFRYTGNPVLDVGPAGAWDSGVATIEKVLIEDDVWHAWYTGARGPAGTAQIGYATSIDGGVTWTKHTANPVLAETPGAWDRSAAIHPFVLPSEDGFRMWYSGIDNTGTFRIGYATSPDGVAWTKRPEPVLDGTGSDGTWNDDGVLRPSIVESEDSLLMWYQATPLMFGVASATNDTSWVHYPGNPVFSDGPRVFYQRVLPDDEGYQMWYTAGNHPNSTIRYATSNDGINWVKSLENPVMEAGGAAWESGGIIVGDVVLDASMYHMWYHNYTPSGPHRTGYAVSPGEYEFNIEPCSPFECWGPYAVWTHLRLDEPIDARFFAIFVPSDPRLPVRPDTVQLFDDGLHGDGGAGDGVYLSSWHPSSAGQYDVHLSMVMGETHEFRLANAGSFEVPPAQNLKVAIYDTTYTPDDFEEGPLTATIFAPHADRGNGAAVILGRYTDADRLTARAWCDTLAARGYLAMTIDYGNLDVSHYPRPQRAFKTAVEFLRRNADQFGLREDRIFGFGQSQGSIVWGQSITFDNDDAFFGTDPVTSDHLAGAILLYGAYDMFNLQLPIQETILAAHFADEPSYRGTRGQVIANAAAVTTPVLLIHGTADAVVDISHSRAFRDSLAAYGRLVTLMEIPGGTHVFDLAPDGAFTTAGLQAKDEVLTWIEQILSTNIETATDVQPFAFHLNQNYPNPFNPTTTITFSVPRAERVQLVVYDVTGRQVASLLDQDMAPGAHEVDFDGAGLASGVYLYRLTAGSFAESRLMILQK